MYEIGYNFCSVTQYIGEYMNWWDSRCWLASAAAEKRGTRGGTCLQAGATRECLESLVFQNKNDG
jgi:hypothetical protein